MEFKTKEIKSLLKEYREKYSDEWSMLVNKKRLSKKEKAFDKILKDQFMRKLRGVGGYIFAVSSWNMAYGRAMPTAIIFGETESGRLMVTDSKNLKNGRYTYEIVSSSRFYIPPKSEVMKAYRKALRFVENFRCKYNMAYTDQSNHRKLIVKGKK